MAKNSLITNTDIVTMTDRQALGRQPDNTPATGGATTGGGGGGSPTGPAGGDLAGTYPNPSLVAIGAGTGPIGDSTHVAATTIDTKGRVTALSSVAIAFPSSLPPSGAAGGDLTGTYPNPALAAIGSATGPIGDSTHVSRVTIDAKGRVTALTSVAITATGGALLYFNVLDYGAIGNGSTDDTAAIQAAINAAAAAGSSCVFFPGPTSFYKISDHLVLPGGFTGNIAMRGAGRRVSKIVQTVSGKDGFNFDLSAGTRENNSAEIADLALYSNVATAGTAITISYGSTNISSSENRSGSIVQRVDINNAAFNSSGTGWTAGVYMINAWHHRISDVYACGEKNGTTGSGAGIRASSGINYSWDNICSELWDQSLLIDSTGGGQGAQGVFLNNINCISCDRFLDISGTACETIILTNWQSDQRVSSAGITATGVSTLLIGYGNIIIDTGTAITLSACNSVNITNNEIDGTGTAPIGIDIQSSTNGVIIQGNVIGGCQTNKDVQVAASCGFVSVDHHNCTDGGGTGNVYGRARGFSVVKNLTGGAPSESINIDISSCFLVGVASAVDCSASSGVPSLIVCQYDFGAGGNTRSNAVIVVSKSDGSNLPAGNIRFGVTVAP